MYFAAEKRYRTARDPHDRDCGALTIMTGWLVLTQAQTWALWNPKVVVTDCDAKEARTGWPLASFQVSGRLFWVLQDHGWEDERYIVAEIGPTAVRYPIQVNGGSC
jgi:hypothetical protein